MTDETRWIALLELHSLKDGNGAFCTAIAWVRDLTGFEILASRELARRGYKLIAIEEADKYSERIQAFEVSAECRKIAEIVGVECPIEFCRLHKFNATHE